MRTLQDNRRALIALAIVIAFVAIVVPTCRMVDCTMKMGGATPFGHQTTPGIFSDCGGEYVVNATPTAVVPAGADALTIALVSAVAASLALFMPRTESPLMRLLVEASPPPSEDPRGERLRV